MNKHTPEPWYSRGCHVMAILDGKEVQIARADLWKVGEDAQKANARRIVACVNACRGLATDDMEHTSLVSAFGYQLIESDRQRDALMAALKRIAAYPETRQQELGVEAIRAIARVAIEKAEGGDK